LNHLTRLIARESFIILSQQILKLKEQVRYNRTLIEAVNTS
jgi:hypothetical protein